MVAFPEMVLTGYPVEDLATRASFRNASINRLSALAQEIAGDGWAQGHSSTLATAQVQTGSDA